MGYKHNKYYKREYDNYNYDEAQGKWPRHATYDRDGKLSAHGGAKELDFDYYYLPEKLAEEPERLDRLVEYYKEKGLFNYMDEQEFRNIMTEYGATGSRMHFVKEALQGTEARYDINYWVMSVAHTVSQTETKVTTRDAKETAYQEQLAANKEKREENFWNRWKPIEEERTMSWVKAGYEISYDDNYNTIVTKDGVSTVLEEVYAKDAWHIPYAPGYQTTAASEANKKPVYIDGVKYDSITEAANAVGISTKTIQRNIDDGKAHKGHTYSSTPVETKKEEVKQEEARTEYVYRQEQTAEDKCEAVLKDCYNKCAKELNTFYDKLEDGYTPTKSELDRMSQYQVMCKNMDEHISEAGKQELVIIKDSLEETAATVLIGYSEEHIEAIANSEFHGANYSERVWNNTETLAEKAKEAVTEAVVLGKSVQEAARDLAAETTHGRNATERLIRTETARVYNKAEEKLYKDVGVEEVEVLVEPDACDDCKALEGKKFKITEAPRLPLHPNCRCDMIPVI